MSLRGLLEPVAWKWPVLTGPRRSNAPGLPDEIYFSVVQRKLLTPDDTADLEAVAEQLIAFEARYNQAARPFDWCFNRDDLDRLLHPDRRLTPDDQWARSLDCRNAASRTRLADRSREQHAAGPTDHR